jgi:hypothetical protein
MDVHALSHTARKKWTHCIFENKRMEIRELLNMAIVQQRNLQFNDLRLQQAKELAIKLMSELKEEYHLK